MHFRLIKYLFKVCVYRWSSCREHARCLMWSNKGLSFIYTVGCLFIFVYFRVFIYRTIMVEVCLKVKSLHTVSLIKILKVNNNEWKFVFYYYEGFSFDLELVCIGKNQEHKLSVSFASNLLAVYSIYQSLLTIFWKLQPIRVTGIVYIFIHITLYTSAIWSCWASRRLRDRICLGGPHQATRQHVWETSWMYAPIVHLNRRNPVSIYRMQNNNVPRWCIDPIYIKMYLTIVVSKTVSFQLAHAK